MIARMTLEIPPELYGNAFLRSDAPDHRLPQVGMPAGDAMRLVAEEMVLDGDVFQRFSKIQMRDVAGNACAVIR